jgi:hypothetical protein
MNVLARTKETQKVMLPEEIRGRLGEARDRMSRLVADQMAAAEDISETGDRRYREVCETMKAVAGEVERYELALAGIEKKAAAELKESQLREQAALRQRVAVILDKRVSVAQAFEKALGEAVREFRALVELSDKAYCAWPAPQHPGGVALGNDELCALVAAELYRLGAVPVVTGRPLTGKPPSLPPPRCPDIMLAGVPERIMPLVQALEQANQAGRDYLEGRR